MSLSETQAILSLSLIAAFVDGDKHDRERAEIRRIAEGLAGADGVNMPTLYQDVLMKRVTLASVAAALHSTEARQLAYEMAVCVCDADGAQSKPEQAFLAEVRTVLGLDITSARHFTEAAEAMAAAPMSAADESPSFKPGMATLAEAAAAKVIAGPLLNAGVAGSTLPVVAAPAPASGAPAVNQQALDQTILNAAITNGALELLPETLSTMAIIPLQMRLVYRIGQAHGYELDRGHIKDFLATAGVGLTSQYLEEAGRKLLGGLLGKLGGGLLRGVGKQALSSGMSFASTYALGHVAKRYYAGGRTLSAQLLKDTYASITEEAQGLKAQYLPAMREQARTLDAGKVMAMVRGR